MKSQDWLGQIPFALVALFCVIEATMWFDCYQLAETSLVKDRHISASTSCNEELEIYRDRLDCTDIKRSLQSGTAWIRAGSCLMTKHNFFALLGWFELAAVAGAAIFLLILTVYYRLKKSKQDTRRSQRYGLISYAGNNYHHQTYPFEQSRGPIIQEID